MRPALLAGALFAAAWVPFLALGGGATGSIATYLGRWQDNDSVHAVVRFALGPAAAKGVCVALLLAGLAWLAIHPAARARPLWWQSYAALALALLLASTVHAWYATWLLPLLAVQLGATRRVPFFAPLHVLAWLLFSGLVALPYLTYDTHEWRLWISFAEYVPLLTLLALAASTRWALPARRPLASPLPAPRGRGGQVGARAGARRAAGPGA
jgi:hypothetical protein